MLGGRKEGLCASLGSPSSWAYTATQWGQTGPQGDQGDPGVFNGVFESPNHQFKLEVTDTGISLKGPTAKILLGGSGIEVSSVAPGDVIALKTPAAKLEVGTATVSVDTPGTVKINGGQVQLNGCMPIARIGDLVDASVPIGHVLTGSPTVCAG